MNGNVFLRNSVTVLLLGCLLLGAASLSQGLWIHAKAQLAQWLILSAWSKTTSTVAVKPWPWADTWPAAKLQVPQQGVELIALEGIEGNSLAFGPGMLTVDHLSGGSQTHVLAGHKDTHFRFLQQLQQNTVVQLIGRNGRLDNYRVTALRIFDSEKEDLNITAENDSLVLITCYPFESLSNAGSLRYVVFAEKMADEKILTQPLRYL